MAGARYDTVADFPAAGWSDSYDDPVSTAVLDLLGPVAGRHILDIACGDGRITRELARRGARVVGIDTSGQSLAKAAAAQHTEPLPVRYMRAGTQTLDGASFDAAVCVSSPDDLDRSLAVVARVLRPQGTFVCSVPDRTLATYATTLRRHGLRLDRFAEPGAVLVARCVHAPWTTVDRAYMKPR